MSNMRFVKKIYGFNIYYSVTEEGFLHLVAFQDRRKYADEKYAIDEQLTLEMACSHLISKAKFNMAKHK